MYSKKSKIQQMTLQCLVYAVILQNAEQRSHLNFMVETAFQEFGELNENGISTVFWVQRKEVVQKGINMETSDFLGTSQIVDPWQNSYWDFMLASITQTVWLLEARCLRLRNCFRHYLLCAMLCNRTQQKLSKNYFQRLSSHSFVPQVPCSSAVFWMEREYIIMGLFYEKMASLLNKTSIK